MSVLDESLARVLVEEGLTPFDEGVSPLVKDTAAKLRDVNKNYKAVLSEIFRRYPMWSRTSGSEEGKAFIEEVDLTEKHKKQERNAILDAFRASLETLKAEQGKM